MKKPNLPFQICPFCDTIFQPKTINHKICSNDCPNHPGKKPYEKGLATGTIGAVAELLVASDLLVKGYSVFRSVSSHCFCDLVAIKGSEIRRIEVRTGTRMANKELNFPGKNQKVQPEVTEVAVYVHSDNSITYIPRS